MQIHRSLRLVLALLVVLASHQIAAAQSSGLFGERNLGSSFTPGSRTLTGTPTGGGLESTDAAGSGAGLLSGNERFVRGNREAGEFVGSDAQDTQNPFSQVGQGGAAPLAGLGQLIAAGQANQPNINNAKSLVQPVLKIGFPQRQPNTTAIASELSARITRRLKSAPGEPAVVVIKNRVATLQGSVATAHDRRLAELMASLEPGVSRVVNELVVADPFADPNQPQASPLDSPRAPQ
jgi:hypothetical protein